MTRSFNGLALVLPLVLACASAVGQAQSLQGAYARVQSHEGRALHGTIESVTDSAVVLMLGERRIAVPRSDIRQIDTAVGRRYGEAMLFGARAGGMVGLTIGFLTAPSCTEEWMCMEPWASMMKGAGIGLLAGTFIGGALAPRRWTAIPADDVRVAIMPVYGGSAGPVVSLRF